MNNLCTFLVVGMVRRHIEPTYRLVHVDNLQRLNVMDRDDSCSESVQNINVVCWNILRVVYSLVICRFHLHSQPQFALNASRLKTASNLLDVDFTAVQRTSLLVSPIPVPLRSYSQSPNCIYILTSTWLFTSTPP